MNFKEYNDEMDKIYKALNINFKKQDDYLMQHSEFIAGHMKTELLEKIINDQIVLPMGNHWAHWWLEVCEKEYHDRIDALLLQK